MIASHEEYVEKRDQFTEETIDNVKKYIENTFVEMYKPYKEQMMSFNRVICTLPYFILTRLNQKELFFTSYDEFCADVIKIYENFVRTEVDFEKFHSTAVPEHLLEYLMTGDVDSHMAEISDHISKLTNDIVIYPFFNSLGQRLIRHKLNDYAHNKIKHMI
jgi:hypothetical protein